MPNCCIPGCKSGLFKRRQELSHFKFTKEPRRRKLWLETVERETGVRMCDESFGKDLRVCHLHFEQSDFSITAGEKGFVKRKLNADAVPSIFTKTPPDDDSDRDSGFTAQHCRICLQRLPPEAHISINEELPSIGMTVVEALSEVFAVEMALSASFPTQVCTKCERNIAIAFNFKQRAQQTEQALAQLDPDSIAIDREIPKKRHKLEKEEEEEETTQTEAEVFESVFEIKVEPPMEDELPVFVFDAIEVPAPEPQAPPAPRRQYEQWPEEIEKARAKQQKKLEPKKKCKKCGFGAANLNELHRHIDSSTGGCIELYESRARCYICDRRFMMLKNKVAHVERDHTDTAPKECPVCRKALRETPGTYEGHLRQHFEAPKLLCTQCGRGFFKNEYYLNHLREAHDDSFWHECDLCGLRVKSHQSIVTHMRKHTRERAAKCDICARHFFNSMALKKHKFLVHKVTHQTVYRCELCDACFLFKSEFERHVICCEGEDRGGGTKSQARIRYRDLVQAKGVISRSDVK